MLIVCPQCSARFNIDDSKAPPPGAKMRCTKCKFIFVREEEGGTPHPPSGRGLKGATILIANDDHVVCDTVEEVMSPLGAKVLKAFDGIDALDIAARQRPNAVICDVALPKLYGFEVCQQIKESEELKGIKVILMASVYDEARYKRNPASLYGADDYIERHHLHDKLPVKLERLLGGSGASQPAGEAAMSAAEKAQAGEKYAEKLSAGTRAIDAGDSEAVEKAKKLARIIVSDIALYNSDHIADGIKSGNLYKLLKEDIIDGIKYFKKRVPSSIPAEAFLKEAFEEFIAKRRKEM